VLNLLSHVVVVLLVRPVRAFFGHAVGGALGEAIHVNKTPTSAFVGTSAAAGASRRVTLQVAGWQRASGSRRAFFVHAVGVALGEAFQVDGLPRPAVFEALLSTRVMWALQITWRRQGVQGPKDSD